MRNDNAAFPRIRVSVNETFMMVTLVANKTITFAFNSPAAPPRLVYIAFMHNSNHAFIQITFSISVL